MATSAFVSFPENLSRALSIDISWLKHDFLIVHLKNFLGDCMPDI